MDPTALVLIFVELLNKVDQQLPRKTSPLYKIGKFRHLLAYIGRFVFPIREPGRLYQNRESPGEIGRLERYVILFKYCYEHIKLMLQLTRYLFLPPDKRVSILLPGNRKLNGRSRNYNPIIVLIN